MNHSLHLFGLISMLPLLLEVTVVLCLVGSPALITPVSLDVASVLLALISALGRGALPAMCVFLTADFSRCAQSATVFISACLGSCQKLSLDMCAFAFPLFFFFFFFALVSEKKRDEFLTVRLHCAV